MSPHVLVLLLVQAAAAHDLRIGVVEPAPGRALQLAAALEAALDEGAALVAPVEPDEPLAAQAHVCAQAADEAAAAVCGGEARAAALGAAAAARAGLPLLLLGPTPAATAAWEALALYPHDDVIAQAVVDLCEAKGWRSAALLHEGSARGVALLSPDADTLKLLPRRLPPPDDDVLLRNLLLVLKKSGVTNFIVWCGAECGARILDAAQRVGLLAERHSYVLATLDLHTVPLADYSHGGANITTLQLYALEDNATAQAVEAWRVAYERRLGSASEARRIAAAPPVALLLAYDAARLVAEAQERLRLPVAAGADCARGSGAFHADTILNYVRSEDWSGIADASWEADGARREVRLRVSEVSRGGALEAAGAWAPRAGLQWRRRARPAPPPPPDSMTNRTFNVLIAKSDPYVMRKESPDRLSGNERYEGFCIELISRLSKLLKFNYTFVEQLDGDYGRYDNKTKQWTGMMKRLMDDPEIHFAITDLTVTAEREGVVDFTTTFMNLGIGILFRRPQPPEPEIFAFLLPFSNGVWLCLGLAYVGTSLLLYVVGRLCPEEWQNPYPCVEEPAALENQFTLANALWFNLGAILLQGSEIAPVAYGSRAVASVWWIFALVITNAYTANLATLLAKKTSTELIHNVVELANNEFGIKYGAKAGGSTYTFFQHSQSPLYQRMFKEMSKEKMPVNNDIGINKVMNENYAFLMESTTIEYTIERNCEVTMVGDTQDNNKGYAIAMKKNSTYRHEMNVALLNLQESGVVREMKRKWWIEKHGGGACKEVDEHESSKLSMASFLGLFLVLVVGCVAGVLISCCDLALAARRPRGPPASFRARFWDELRFVFSFDRSVKPLQGPLIEDSPSTSAARSSSTRGELEEEGEGEGPEQERLRSMSLQSAGAGAGAGAGAEAGAGRRWSRRRSSMHAASVRLARHASRRDRRSSSPAHAHSHRHDADGSK